MLFHEMPNEPYYRERSARLTLPAFFSAIFTWRQRCARENCDTRATFGDPATGRREFCSKHAPAGMHNVERKKCARQGCPLPPAYGDPTNRKRR